MPSGNVEPEIVIQEIDFAKTTNLVKIMRAKYFFGLYQKIKSILVP